MNSTDTAAVCEEMSVVPYEAALVKLHKTPVALRFLACSAANGLGRPAVWLTSLFYRQNCGNNSSEACQFMLHALLHCNSSFVSALCNMHD
jgi:hypothetical protein